MTLRNADRRRNFVVAQVLGALSAFALIALAPPAQGTMLLVPVAGQPQGQVMSLAIAHGATVMRRGPLPSSIVISGDRAQLLLPLAGAGIVAVAGGAAGCGGETAGISA